jgi:hypothetical protein
VDSAGLLGGIDHLGEGPGMRVSDTGLMPRSPAATKARRRREHEVVQCVVHAAEPVQQASGKPVRLLLFRRAAHVAQVAGKTLMRVRDRVRDRLRVGHAQRAAREPYGVVRVAQRRI